MNLLAQGHSSANLGRLCFGKTMALTCRLYGDNVDQNPGAGICFFLYLLAVCVIGHCYLQRVDTILLIPYHDCAKEHGHCPLSVKKAPDISQGSLATHYLLVEFSVTSCLLLPI